jgi:hypothetical protein
MGAGAARWDAAVMESIVYIECSLPPSITIAEYRRTRPSARRRRGLRRWFH